MSSVNVGQMDHHNPSFTIHEILEASRLNKNKDILQLLGKINANVYELTSGFVGQYLSKLLVSLSNNIE